MEKRLRLEREKSLGGRNLENVLRRQRRKNQTAEKLADQRNRGAPESPGLG